VKLAAGGRWWLHHHRELQELANALQKKKGGASFRVAIKNNGSQRMRKNVLSKQANGRK